MPKDEWYYDPDTDRPCPWCGGMEPDPDIADDDLVMDLGKDLRGQLYFYVWCQNCDATGPSALTPREAWERWNKRPPHTILSLSKSPL